MLTRTLEFKKRQNTKRRELERQRMKPRQKDKINRQRQGKKAKSRQKTIIQKTTQKYRKRRPKQEKILKGNN